MQRRNCTYSIPLGILACFTKIWLCELMDLLEVMILLGCAVHKKLTVNMKIAI
jgi:hypothetical protein